MSMDAIGNGGGAVAGCWPQEPGRFERLGDLSPLYNEIIIHILLFLSELKDLHHFGLVCRTCLDLSRSDVLWRQRMFQWSPRIWESLNPFQQEGVLANHTRHSYLHDPLEYVGPICYKNKPLRSPHVDGDYLAHSYSTDKKQGFRLWNHQKGEISEFYPYNFIGMGEGVIMVSSWMRLEFFDQKTMECLSSLRILPYSLKRALISGDKVGLEHSDYSVLKNWKTGCLLGRFDSEKLLPKVFMFAECAVFQCDYQRFHLIKLETGERVCDLEVDRSDPVFRCTGTTLLVVDSKAVRRFDAETGEEKGPLKVKGEARNTCLAVEGDLALCGDKEGMLRLWNVNTGRLLHAWKTGHQDLIGCELLEGLAYSYSSGVLENRQGKIKIWDLAQGALCQELEFVARIKKCTFLPNKVIIEFPFSDEVDASRTFVFSRKSAKLPPLVQQPTKEQAAERKQRKIQHAKYGKLAALSETLILKCLSHIDDPKDLGHFSLASKGCCQLGRRAALWSRLLEQEFPKTAAQKGTLPWADYRFYRMELDPFECVGPIQYNDNHIDACAADHQHFVSRAYKDALQVWNHQTGEKLPTLFGHEGHISNIVMNPEYVASLGDFQTIKVSDRKSGECLKIISLEGRSRIDTFYLADRCIIVRVPNEVSVWNFTADEPVFKVKVGLVARGPFVLGDLLLVEEFFCTFSLFDLKTGEKRCKLGTRELRGVARSGEGIYVGTSAQGILQFDAQTGDLVRSFKKSEQKVEECFTEGRIVIGQMEDGSIEVWDRWTAEFLRSWKPTEGKLRWCQLKESLFYCLEEESSTLQIWDPLTGKHLQDLSNQSENPEEMMTKVCALGSATILKLGRYVSYEGKPNVFVWARPSQKHPRLKKVIGPYAEKPIEREA